MVYRICKRCFDLLCSIIGIIGTFPIWIISIILILISDWGPVFYFANRVGENNRTFKMWKFRSMRVLPTSAAVAEASLRPEQDRIFLWGRIMRRLKIDELPQLINIINGTMSIVGPRPASFDQIAVTRAGENACVASVPCGLTSPSSLYDYIYGDQFTDESEYNEKVLPTRLALDVWYVRMVDKSGCFTVWGYDLKFIFWTIVAIIYAIARRRPDWMLRNLAQNCQDVKQT